MMLLALFQRVKVIMVVCLFISVALPTVSHAFEASSEAHCEESITSVDHHAAGTNLNQADHADKDADNCDCCHSGCCNLKTLSKLSPISHTLSIENLTFSHVSEFLNGTSVTNLFRPPKSLV